MLSRREFLGQAVGATVTLILTPIVAASCSSSSNGGTSISTNPTSPGCAGVEETSTVAESHTHTVCVATSDLSSPPAGGMSYTTSTDSGHSHRVAFSSAQLSTINAGGSVTVETSNEVDPVNGVAHTHAFTVTMATSSQPAPAPGNGAVYTSP